MDLHEQITVASSAVGAFKYNHSVLSLKKCQSLFMHQVTRVEIIPLRHKDTIKPKHFSVTSNKAANRNKEDVEVKMVVI